MEVRRLRSDGEFAQYVQTAIYAFNAPRDESQVERYRAIYDPSWCLGAFDGGDLIAGLTILPFDQHLLGQAVPFGGIATVASLPERRREGAVGALLRGALVEMRDAGQVLSGLYTPHYSLYRRFGWEISHRMLAYSFPPKVLQTRVPRPQGSFDRVGVDRWQTLAALREPFMATRNGALLRTETRWRNHVFSQDSKGTHDAVVWSNAAGEPRGYAVYRQDKRQAGGPWGETILRVVDWLVLDGDAYAALLNYLMSHDLVDQIVMVVSEDEPLLMTLDEPLHLKAPIGDWIGMLTRIVDVEGAFAARRSTWEGSRSVVIGVSDRSAPWNDGAWQITTDGGTLSATKTNTSPDLECDVTALAPIYNGFLTVENAARAGMLKICNVAAATALQRVLAVPYPPYCPDDF